MEYMNNCRTCMNYRNENIWGNQVQYCAAGVSFPLKCTLRPKKIDPDWQEFFNATCERFSKWIYLKK